MAVLRKSIALLAITTLLLVTLLAGMGSALAEEGVPSTQAEETASGSEENASEAPAEEVADEEEAPDEEPLVEEEEAEDPIEDEGTSEDEPAESPLPVEDTLTELVKEDPASEPADDEPNSKYEVEEKTPAALEFEPLEELPEPAVETAPESEAMCCGGSICGYKFLDEDCDGEWDDGEPGIEGVKIILNGKRCAWTDGNGYFCFTDLWVGCYKVEVDESTVPPGHYSSTPNPVFVWLAWPCWMHKTVYFGNAPYGSICAFKFLDRNCNGEWDEGEPGIPGVKVILNGEVCGRTDRNGYYCFKELKPSCLVGEYSVAVDESTAPWGLYASTPNPVSVWLECGKEVLVIFGNAPYGSICGHKFWDQNCNGKWDKGEPPMEGVTICLFKCGGENDISIESTHGCVDCTQTDENGRYCFRKLKPGCYRVFEMSPRGFYSTTPNPVHVMLCCGKHRRCVNFGNAEYGSICGYKFLDQDCDGEWDEGEPGIPGVKVCMSKGTNGQLPPDVSEDNCCGGWCTITDEEGHFCFCRLKPGEYTVEVDESTVPPGHYASTPNPIVLELGCGEDAEVLFGNAPYGSICGYKFLDEDCDGEWDDGELGIPGVTVCLSMEEQNGAVPVALEEENGNGLALCTETDEEGHFCFEGLVHGTYIVEVDESTAPPGHYASTPNPAVVELGCGGNAEVFFGNAPYGSICGYKFLDLNGDGIMDEDEDEVGIAGVTVTLTGDGIDETTVTDEDGYFCFLSELKPGDYTIEVDESTVPPGHFPSTPNPLVYTLSCGEDAVVYFGNTPKRSITGYKYVDSNTNGNYDSSVDTELWDGSDIPITITLYQNGEQIDMTMIDSSDGMYQFTDLLPGDYTIEETYPAGEGIQTLASTSIEVTVQPDADLEVSKPFLNFIVQAAPAVIEPEVTPEVVGPQQLPATGWDQLPLFLAAAALMLLGLMALMLGLLQLRRS
ncbi:MAG: hypothetical protein JW854_07640 [Actinobacteria bacterium]|nr:hypothetical protein [Actinomycetota bacterium]